MNWNEICATGNAFLLFFAAVQALIMGFNPKIHSRAHNTRAPPTRDLGVEARGNVMLAEQRHQTHYMKHQTNMAVIYMVNTDQSRFFFFFYISGCDSQEGADSFKANASTVSGIAPSIKRAKVLNASGGLAQIWTRTQSHV